MNTSRRNFVRHATLGAAAASVAPLVQGAPSAPGGRRIRLAVSTYSYWHFTPEKYPVEKVIEDAAALGFDGVEVLHVEMPEESPTYLNKLKRLAFVNGLDLVMLSIHQNFASPDAAERQAAIDHTKHCIDLAVQLGTPAIRLNSGRWNTLKSFDDLMAAKGQEPPLPGYKLDDAFNWCIDSIEKCIPAAEKAGVVLSLENHWGLTTQPLLRIYNAIRSPWLGITLDTGNFAATRTPSWNRSLLIPRSCRSRPTTEEVSGTPSIWTIRRSQASFARRTITGTFHSRWRARNQPPQRCRKAWNCSTACSGSQASRQRR